MIGSYSRFIWEFPETIVHNDGTDPYRIKRYTIGRRRLQFLKNHCTPFAFGQDSHEGKHIVSFLVELEEEDLDSDMPQDIKYEYIAGSIYPNEATHLFAYLWFTYLEDAINYAKSKQMKVIGGWNGRI